MLSWNALAFSLLFRKMMRAILFSLLVFALDGQRRLAGFCLLQRAFGASQHASNSALFLLLCDNRGNCQTQGNDN